MSQPQRAPVAEPWMARPDPQAAVGGQAWQSPIAEPTKGPALEPIDLPPAIEQGVDMIYIDESLVPRAAHNRGFLAGINDASWSAAPVDLFTSVNPIYTDLRRGLIKYEQTWGSLPQIQIPEGPALKTGSTGDRVAALRTRLGLADGTSYDAALASRVKAFQSVHGLKSDGVAGAGTLQALNRGSDYYEQLIIINMERAKRLPKSSPNMCSSIQATRAFPCGRTAGRSTR
jgi:murein L,D-transpeptidase YcbB/YkuD